MKKQFILPLTLLLLLTGCAKSESTIHVVATEIPHAEILQQATAPLLAEGYHLKVTVIDNYSLGNPAVSNGSADANYFQHVPYFNAYNESVNTAEQLVNVGGVHIEPIGLYAGSRAHINDLQDGDTIIISNNIPDYGRIVSFLHELNLVTVAPDFVATAPLVHPEEAILTRSVNFTFKIIEARLLVAAHKNKEGALFFINGNYALSGGLNKEDILVSEPTVNNPYVNIVAVKKGSENNEKTKALISVLKSDLIKQFITNHYNGAVIVA